MINSIKPHKSKTVKAKSQGKKKTKAEKDIANENIKKRKLKEAFKEDDLKKTYKRMNTSINDKDKVTY